MLAQQRRASQPRACRPAGALKPAHPREAPEPTGTRQGAPGSLEEWARGREASWGVWPLRQLHRGKIIQTGWTVELFARCPEPREAAELSARLLVIARDALPADSADVAFRALPYDGSFRIGPETTWVPEVRITIEVTHRRDCFEAADELQWEAVRAFEARLRAIELHKRR